MKIKKPNLFVVGKAKSGTTGLYWILNQHPEIFLQEKKDLGFFAKDVGKGPKKIKSEKEYKKLFSEANGEKYLGDVSARHMVSKTAAKEIKKFNPNSKIIIMLREPIEFLMSWYQHKNFKKPEKEKPSFEEFINEKENKERLKYSEQIKRYIKEFPRKNIHIIIYEDFKKDNLKEFKKVCKFLEVDENFKPAITQRNPRKVVRKNFISKLIRKIPTKKIREFSEKNFNPKIYNKIRKIVFSLVFKKQNWRINPELKNKLKKQLKPEVEKVDKLLHKEGFLEKNRSWVSEEGYDRIK